MDSMKDLYLSKCSGSPWTPIFFKSPNFLLRTVSLRETPCIMQAFSALAVNACHCSTSAYDPPNSPMEYSTATSVMLFGTGIIRMRTKSPTAIPNLL